MNNRSDNASRLAFSVRFFPMSHDPIRILIVEDDPSPRAMLQRWLQQHQFEVAVACNGLEALRRCADESFDLLLLDLLMPVMNGLEFLRHYDQLEGATDNVVIMTNRPAHEVMEDRPPRVLDVLAKPFELVRLLGTMEQCLARRQR